MVNIDANLCLKSVLTPNRQSNHKEPILFLPKHNPFLRFWCARFFDQNYKGAALFRNLGELALTVELFSKQKFHFLRFLTCFWTFFWFLNLRVPPPLELELPMFGAPPDQLAPMVQPAPTVVPMRAVTMLVRRLLPAPIRKSYTALLSIRLGQWKCYLGKMFSDFNES